MTDLSSDYQTPHILKRHIPEFPTPSASIARLAGEGPAGARNIHDINVTII